jgi:hypothetical protein
VYLTEQEYDGLQGVAELSGVTPNAVIRVALRALLKLPNPSGLEQRLVEARREVIRERSGKLIRS